MGSDNQINIKMWRLNNQSGFTLVEIIAATMSAIFVIFAAGTFYRSMLGFFVQGDTRVQMQREASLALQEFKRKIGTGSFFVVSADHKELEIFYPQEPYIDGSGENNMDGRFDNTEDYRDTYDDDTWNCASNDGNYDGMTHAANIPSITFYQEGSSLMKKSSDNEGGVLVLDNLDIVNGINFQRIRWDRNEEVFFQDDDDENSRLVEIRLTLSDPGLDNENINFHATFIVENGS